MPSLACRCQRCHLLRFPRYEFMFARALMTCVCMDVNGAGGITVYNSQGRYLLANRVVGFGSGSNPDLIRKE